MREMLAGCWVVAEEGQGRGFRGELDSAAMEDGRRRGQSWLRRKLKRRREQRHGDASTRTPRSCGGASRGVDEGDGGLVNNSKFQNAVCKISFSPSTWPQMKNF